ncbi:glycosyltransferase family 39 protein [Gammaproteobacteria bacterium]|nr:glycosyltransferase family 39 protein [Gammaproteobacteria bacterium]
MNTKIKPIFLLSIFCFALYSLPYLVSSKITVTDELCFDYFSSLVADHGTLKYIPEGDRLFGFPGFVPRSFSYTASGEAVPKQPPGFILLAAIAKTITPGKLFFLINPVLGVCCVLLLYGIGRCLLGDDQRAFWAALLLASAPIFFHWTQMFFADIANLVAFLLSLWCLLRALDTQRLTYLVGFGLSLGAMIWMRQSSGILLIPIAIYLFLNRHRIGLESCWPPAVSFGITIALLVIFNIQVYGGPFRTGYTMGTVPTPDTIGSGLTLLDQYASDLMRLAQYSIPTFELLWPRVKGFPLSFTLAFPPLLLAFIGLIFGLKTLGKRSFALFLWSTFFVMFFFFGGRETYGIERAELTLQSSFLRYMLPFFVLLPIPAVWALEKLKVTRMRWVLLIALLNLGGATFSHFGLIHATLNRIYMEDVARFVIDNTDDKTVVFSPYWHSIIFPDRLVRSRPPASGEELTYITEGVLRKGFSVAFIYHASDSMIFEALNKNTALEKVTGPNKLNAIFKMLPVPIPKHVYPVTLLKISPTIQLSTD